MTARPLLVIGSDGLLQALQSGDTPASAVTTSAGASDAGKLPVLNSNGAVDVAAGGTGARTLPNGILKGDGTASPVTNAVPGVDYLAPDETIDGGVFP
jgi:hypothetical protein